MRSLRRLAVPALVASACLVAMPASASAAVLPPERYEPIDAVYTASVALDGRETTPARLARARRACEGLSSSDALLRGLRGSCRDSVATTSAALSFGECDSRTACRRASSQLRRVLTRVLTSARPANRAIDANVGDAACRKALRTPASELQTARRLITGLRGLERALRSGSSRAVARAEQRLSGIGGRDIPLETQRSRFRQACD